MTIRRVEKSTPWDPEDCVEIDAKRGWCQRSCCPGCTGCERCWPPASAMLPSAPRARSPALTSCAEDATALRACAWRCMSCCLCCWPIAAARDTGIAVGDGVSVSEWFAIPVSRQSTLMFSMSRSELQHFPKADKRQKKNSRMALQHSFQRESYLKYRSGG